MAAKKGHAKVGGRTRGTPNKTTALLTDMILGALADVGGQDYLAAIAQDRPEDFLKLLAKVLPMQVSGPEGGAIKITWQS